MADLKIKYLKHDKINQKVWDEVIRDSYNCNVYALSSYLNITTQGKWDALVAGNYDYVMPIPVKKKFFIKVSLHPLFNQQLGIFSPHKISREIVKDFVDAIPESIKYLELKFNKFNDLSLVTKGEIIPNVNFELDLILPYQDLFKKFSANTKRNIKKALNNNIKTVFIDNKSFFNFFRYYFSKQFKGVLGKKDFTTFKKLVDFGVLKSNFTPVFLGAVNNEAKLIATAFFIKHKNKIYYIDGISSPEGKDKSAMFLIFDHIIRTYSGNNMILDFEGSNIESVARFYKGFGSMQTQYNTLIINKLGSLAKLKRK